MEPEDKLVRMRKLLARKQIAVNRKIKESVRPGDPVGHDRGQERDPEKRGREDRALFRAQGAR